MAFQYWIDGEDRITRWSREYSDFANANDGGEIASTSMKGRLLWDFIDDAQTRLIYRSLVERVRSGNDATFTFRCDGPTVRRSLEMSIADSGSGDICFSVRTVKATNRPNQALLDRRAPRSDQVLPFCSWCSKIRIDAGPWHEVEQAVELLDLFTSPEMPRLDYVMCDACYSARMPPV